MPGTLTTELLWDLPRVGTPSADADGRVVVVPVTTTTRDEREVVLWQVAPDGAHRQLTAGGAVAGSPRVAPDGSRVAFVRPVDGRPQVHVLPLDGGEATCVTDLPLGVTGSATWVGSDRLLVVGEVLAADPTPEATAAWRDAGDQRVAAHVTERRVHAAWDTLYDDALTEHVFLVDLDGDTPPRDCTPGVWRLPDPLRDAAANAAVSPDGRWLAVTTSDPRGVTEDRSARVRCHVVDLTAATPEVRPVTSADTQAGPPRFLPDGRIVLALRLDPHFYAAPQDVVAIDPASGEHEVLLAQHEEQLAELAVGPDGRIVVAGDVRGRGVLLEVRDGRAWPLAGATVGPAGAGGVSAPVVTRSGVVAVHAGLLAPPEVALVDDDGCRVLTSFARDMLADVDLGRVEERTVTGGDGDDVQVLLVHPPAAATTDRTGPPPLVQLVHGGPHGVFGDTWHWRWSAARFAAEGWVAACVNFHGSTSFGHAFTTSINGDWGTLPTADVLAATEALVADGTVDGDRLAVAGGSYGGYLTSWLVATTDRFHAAVAHAAVTDLAGMLASDWTAGLATSFGAAPWEDPTRVQQASPSWRWSGLSTPTLVTHGARDLRVPLDQGRALYGALQARGVPARFVLYPDENHWVLDRGRSEHWYGEVLGWLHRWLDG